MLFWHFMKNLQMNDNWCYTYRQIRNIKFILISFRFETAVYNVYKWVVATKRKFKRQECLLQLLLSCWIVVYGCLSPLSYMNIHHEGILTRYLAYTYLVYQVNWTTIFFFYNFQGKDFRHQTCTILSNINFFSITNKF